MSKFFRSEKFIDGANHGAGVAVGGLVVSGVIALGTWGYQKIKSLCSSSDDDE